MTVDFTLGDTKSIIEEATDRGLLRNQLAYVLATAKWETAHTMKPVRETRASTDDKAIAILDRAWANGQLPWVSKAYWRRDPEGKSWLGRGYVQLTHKTNYKRAGSELNVDMVTDPNAAMDPTIARQVIVRGMVKGWFTGHKLSDYITLRTSDFVNARRIINGMDKAAPIAKIARLYDEALTTMGYGVEEDGAARVEPRVGSSFTQFRVALMNILKGLNPNEN